ncbi:hypothetical protein ACWM3R_001445 [Vibrio cholerae]
MTLEFVILNAFSAVLDILIGSIIPAVIGAVASNLENEDKFKYYFLKPDSYTFFTDAKLIRMREEFTKEYKHRCKNLIFFVLISGSLLFGISMYSSNLAFVSDSSQEIISVILALSYILGCSYLAALLGASSGRLQATKPLMEWQKERICKILATSPHSIELLNLIESNPKSKLAQIDYLHFRHVNKELAARKVEQIRALVEQKL